MKLPDPALLLVTDRHQARLPLADIVRAALSAGCRWVSVREKDLSDEDQIALALTLLPIARRHGARLTLHGDAALAKACGSDGVHLAAGPVGIAVMGSIMRAVDPGQEMKALLAIVAGAPPRAR